MAWLRFVKLTLNKPQDLSNLSVWIDKIKVGMFSHDAQCHILWEKNKSNHHFFQHTEMSNVMQFIQQLKLFQSWLMQQNSDHKRTSRSTTE